MHILDEDRVNKAVNEWQYIVLLGGCHGDDKRTGRLSGKHFWERGRMHSIVHENFPKKVISKCTKKATSM